MGGNLPVLAQNNDGLGARDAPCPANCPEDPLQQIGAPTHIQATACPANTQQPDGSCEGVFAVNTAQASAFIVSFHTQNFGGADFRVAWNCPDPTLKLFLKVQIGDYGKTKLLDCRAESYRWSVDQYLPHRPLASSVRSREPDRVQPTVQLAVLRRSACNIPSFLLARFSVPEALLTLDWADCSAANGTASQTKLPITAARGCVIVESRDRPRDKWKIVRATKEVASGEGKGERIGRQRFLVDRTRCPILVELVLGVGKRTVVSDAGELRF